MIVPRHFSIGFYREYSLEESKFLMRVDPVSYNSNKIVIDKNLFISLVKDEVRKETFNLILDTIKNTNARIEETLNSSVTHWRNYVYVLYDNKNHYLKAKLGT